MEDVNDENKMEDETDEEIPVDDDLRDGIEEMKNQELIDLLTYGGDLSVPDDDGLDED